MNGDTGGGYMHFVPFVAEPRTKISGMITSMLPWGAPSFAAMTVTTSGVSPEPALAVAVEWPVSWMRIVEPESKFDIEWLRLQRFSSDHALSGGTHAFTHVQPGSDPPDATVQTNTGQLGVESTALTIESRRAVQGLFMQLRRRLREVESAAFVKLRGHLVYVWFQESSQVGLDKPHKRSDATALDMLVQALADYEPQGQQLWAPGSGPPKPMPELPLEDTSAGATFYAVPLVNSVPSTMLFTVAGFEIALAYTTTFTAKDVWSEMQRLIDVHDQPGVDLLLVTAGGPDAWGNVFPSEEAVAEFLATHPLGLNRAPSHIKTVILHRWATGQATVLYPEVRPLFGPLYKSMVPLHYPMVIPVEAVESQ